MQGMGTGRPVLAVTSEGTFTTEKSVLERACGGWAT